MRRPLKKAIEKRVLLSDGAMGTQLIEAGLETGQCGAEWNLSAPDRVAAVQTAYVDAGADLLITNTFQASPIALTRHNLAEKAYQINLHAARIARDCVGEGGYVLGDVGPFGGFLEPLGNTSRRELEAAFAEQIAGLLDGGVDAIIIETMTSLEEMETAVTAARACREHVLLIVSVTFDRLADGTFRTMTGNSVEDTVRFLTQLDVEVLGCNCGTGLHIKDYVRLVGDYRKLTDRPIMVQPNAGQPRLERGSRPRATGSRQDTATYSRDRPHRRRQQGQRSGSVMSSSSYDTHAVGHEKGRLTKTPTRWSPPLRTLPTARR